jgi:hypothetical protein
MSWTFDAVIVSELAEMTCSPERPRYLTSQLLVLPDGRLSKSKDYSHMADHL